jgi:anti-sigma B factor antagonist
MVVESNHMRDAPLSIERIINDGVETMKLTGPLTLSTLFEMQESLRTDPQPKTIIDLSGVPYIDSAGLGALLSFHASCKREGRVYVLAAMAPRVQTIFTASKVDSLVHVLPTVAEAQTFLTK